MEKGCLWGAAVQGLTSGHCHMSHFRKWSHTYCWKQSPQQIESVVSFNYFSRCHYQKFLCKYIFYSLRHVNMRPKLYNTPRKTTFSFDSSLSLLLGACYWITKVLKLSQRLCLWYSVCRIIGMQYCYSIIQHISIQWTFTVCLLWVSCWAHAIESADTINKTNP